MIAIIIATLFTQYIWCDCIVSPEKYSAFNISKLVFLEIQNKVIRPVLSDLVTFVFPVWFNSTTNTWFIITKYLANEIYL